MPLGRPPALPSFNEADLLLSNCGLFAAEMITTQNVPPFHGRFLIGPHHLRWAEALSTHRKCLFIACRGGGKCMARGRWILRASGERVPVEQWDGGDVYAYDTLNHKFVQTYAPARGPSFWAPGVRIRTASGRETEVSLEHPFLTVDGWIEAKDVELGVRIAAPRQTPVFGQNEVEDAYLIGVLLGDGTLTGTTMGFHKEDAGVVAAVRELTEVSDWSATTREGRWGLPGYNGRARELGIIGKDAHSKRVPSALFTANEASLRRFLAGYFDTDANVTPKHAKLEFYSVSKAWLQDIQHLLSRLDVLAALHPKLGKYKGEDRHSWRLTISGADNVRRFIAKIHPRGFRKQELEEISVWLDREEGRGDGRGGTLDVIPGQVQRRLRKSSHWHKKATGAVPRPDRAVTRRKLRQMAEAEGNFELVALANSPVFWDEIVSVEYVERLEFFPIEVPGLENYIGDDLVQHNSQFISQAYPLWMAVRFPKRDGLIVSGTEKMALRLMLELKQCIERSPKLAYLKPKKASGWAASQIELSNGVIIRAASYTAQLRGLHPKWMVFDDMLSDKDLTSAEIREGNAALFNTKFFPMAMQDTQIVIVGTPFHTNDTYAALRRDPSWFYERTPAILDHGAPTERSFWPEYRSLEFIKNDIAKGMTSIQFAREYLVEPLSDAASLFPSEFFGSREAQVKDIELGAPREAFEAHGVKHFYVGVDFGLSATSGRDFTVLFVIGIDDRGNTWIVDIVRRHGLEFQQQLAEIRAICARYRPEFAYLEANQAQRIFGAELRRTTDLPIRQFHTTSEKHSLEKGVPGLRLPFEQRKIRIPSAELTGDRLAAMRAWVCEMQAMTLIDGRIESTETHDDTVMAYYIATQAAKSNRFAPVFTGEVDADFATPPDVDPTLLERLGLTGRSHLTAAELNQLSDAQVLELYGNQHDFGLLSGTRQMIHTVGGSSPGHAAAQIHRGEGIEPVPGAVPSTPGALVYRRKSAPITGQPGLNWAALLGKE